ncbi:UNVERIFIED_CONTAM: hypothetical protein ABIE34_004211 [Jeotgalibacillus campisalis]
MYRRWRLAILTVAVILLTGCGVSVPADPQGTLDRVSGGVLRVGASPNGDWVKLTSSGEPTGTEAELVRRFAAQLDARVEWSTGTEHILAERVEHGELDLMIGGLREDTPWEKHAALTQPYTESVDDTGKKHKHVMLVAKGENGFLLTLDTFLKESEGTK